MVQAKELEPRRVMNCSHVDDEEGGRPKLTDWA